jgi:RNA polymerase sigma-70 factor (ECF subfamily)
MSDENVKMSDTRGLTPENLTIDDPILVARAKSADASAFGELYRRHRSRVYRSAQRILRDSQDAEDIVQRTFQRAFTNLKRFREDAAFSTWVTRIGINESLMLMRQRRGRIHVSETCDSSDSIAVLNLRDSRPTPEQAMAEREMQTAVRDAVYRLRESLRSVVILQVFKGLTSVETAKRLGLSVEAVKGRMFHARRHLRRNLTPKYKLRGADVLIGN